MGNAPGHQLHPTPPPPPTGTCRVEGVHQEKRQWWEEERWAQEGPGLRGGLDVSLMVPVLLPSGSPLELNWQVAGTRSQDGEDGVGQDAGWESGGQEFR